MRIRMSTGGRVTIPRELRNEHGLVPGKRFHLWIEGGSILIALAKDDAI
jgi:bifunctional DNA-binding transcriptional regulator/antitoxin component of YhaV-PrlF toxin-antitoxin module